MFKTRDKQCLIVQLILLFLFLQDLLQNIYCHSTHDCIHDALLVLPKEAKDLAHCQQLPMSVQNYHTATSMDIYELVQPIRISFEQLLPSSGDTTHNCQENDQVSVMSSTEHCFMYECNLDHDLVTQEHTQRVSTVLERVYLYLMERIHVVPVQTPLTISKTKRDEYETSCLHDCIRLTMLETDTVVVNADLLIYITQRPVLDGTASWSRSLAIDQFGRPVLGHLNIGPREVVQLSDDALFDIVLHEMLHLLGFSASLFPPKQVVVEEEEEEELSIPTLVSPHVVSMLQSHLQCPLITGAALESTFATTITTTGSSHWNKRLFGNELMTRRIEENDGVVSDITWASLHDTTWYYYQPSSSSSSSTYTYRQGEGCSPDINDCALWSKEYACMPTDLSTTTTLPTTHCSKDKSTSRTCTKAIEYNTPLPLYYQLDPTNDPTLGGDAMYDYCTIMVPFVHCKDGNEDLDAVRYAETFGDTSACFEQSLYLGFGTSSMAGRCHQIKCSSSSSSLTVLSVKLLEEWFVCDVQGTEIKLENYSGSFICPDPALYCKKQEEEEEEEPNKECPCDAVSCWNDQCLCTLGTTGPKCTQKTCLFNNGMECNGVGTCNRETGTCTCVLPWIGPGCALERVKYENNEELMIIQVPEDGIVLDSITSNAVFTHGEWEYYKVDLKQEEEEEQDDVEIVIEVVPIVGTTQVLFLSFETPPTLDKYDSFDPISWLSYGRSYEYHYYHSTSTTEDKKQLYIGLYTLSPQPLPSSSSTNKKKDQHVSIQLYTIQDSICPTNYPPCSSSSSHGTCIKEPTEIYCKCIHPETVAGIHCTTKVTHLSNQHASCVEIVEEEEEEQYEEVHFSIYVQDTQHPIQVSLQYIMQEEEEEDKSYGRRLLARHEQLPQLGDEVSLMSLSPLSHQEIVLSRQGLWYITVLSFKSVNDKDIPELCIDMILPERVVECTAELCSLHGIFTKDKTCICDHTQQLSGAVYGGYCCTSLISFTLPHFHFGSFVADTITQIIPSADHQQQQKQKNKTQVLALVDVEVPFTYHLLLLKDFLPPYRIMIESSSNQRLGIFSIIDQVLVPHSTLDVDTNPTHLLIPNTYSSVVHSFKEKAVMIVVYGNEKEKIKLRVHVERNTEDDDDDGSLENRKIPQDQKEGKDKDNKQVIIISAAIGGIAVVVLLVGLATKQHMKRRQDATGNRKRRDSTFVPVAMDRFSASTIVGSDGIDRWCLAVDPQTGSMYYYNERTRETRWEPPELCDEDGEELPIDPDDIEL